MPLTEVRGAAVELSEAQFLAFYEAMLTGRILEECLLAAGPSGRGGFRFPGSGQEAAQVGFAAALDPGDVLAPGHRDLLAALVRGVTLEEALLDLFGKAAGPSGGRRPGGAPAPARGVLGVGGATGDGVAVAVGAALAFHCRGEARVALACCGEGTAATGAWHEAVNTAAVLGLPVVFAVANNQYAGSLPNEAVSRLAYTAHRADGYGIPGVVVDGNDVLEVYAAAREAVERARSGGGPSLVEAVTFRRLGHHVDDPADYVDPDARASWLARDPLPRFEEFLGSRGLLDGARRDYLQDRVRARVAGALEWARQQADPGTESAPAPASRGEPGEERPAGAALAGGEPETMAGALSRALADEMERDESVVVLGAGVGRAGGPYGITSGLRERYGPRRVIDITGAGPGLVGAAVGAARHGLRPVVEVPARDLPAAWGLLAAHAGDGGQPVPLVLRVPCGPGPGAAWDLPEFAGRAASPGFKVVIPATADAAQGLLTAAIRDPGPVVFIEPVSLYPVAAPLPSAGQPARLGEARVARDGGAVTVVAWGAGVTAALEAAESAAAQGVAPDVIDLQTLSPFDLEPLLASVERTGRLVVVSDAAGPGGFGAEVAARVAQEGFWHLDAPVRRVAPPARVQLVPEGAAGPAPADILAAILSLAHT